MLVKIFGETSFGEMSINTAMVYVVLTFLNKSRGPDVGGIKVGGFGGIGSFFWIIFAPERCPVHPPRQMILPPWINESRHLLLVSGQKQRIQI